MYNPAATYRIQFHKGFTFHDLDKIIPYLKKSGISTLYASPVFESAPGSMHGYDTVNPLKINPEIGTIDELRSISARLKKNGIGWLQDIVPNHMAYHVNNLWLMDVLEKGPKSLYKDYFDTSFADDLFQGPVMAPFLGNPLNEVIENGELTIASEKQQLVFKYFDNSWPLCLASYLVILTNGETKPGKAAKLLIDQITEAQQLSDSAAYAKAANGIKTKLSAAEPFLTEQLAEINQNNQLLQELAGKQYYRLCGWQETDETINYRRFFTVNGLICLNIHKKEVFNHFHQLISELCIGGIFQGLRIDHIDGLYNPDQYLKDLRQLTGDETYIVVEKILEPGESLSTLWPIQGSTGYDYLALVNNLFTSNASRDSFTKFYHQLTGNTKPVDQQIEEKKEFILAHHMAGELNNLTNLLLESGLIGQNELKKIPVDDLKKTIGQFLIRCPVYRYYSHQFPLDAQESAAVQTILNRIKRSDKSLSAAVGLLTAIFLEKPRNPELAGKALHFYRRCMQFTGPLMAKGVEDTLMYTYNRFIDHNEVGDAPEAFGITTGQFHQQMQARQMQWPLSLNATSTHDTKRGEGVRSRLNVLSDLGDEWLQAIKHWQGMNRGLKTGDAPDVNDELFIYQTLIGSYPMPGDDEQNYGERLSEYLEKALREGKHHTNWAEPNVEYEEAVKRFALSLLDKDKPFWKSFSALHSQVADFGILNSLAQVILKFACPGIPDVYQGCEQWDLSLVDPDNRRPVDFKTNGHLLRDLTKPGTHGSINSLWEDRFSGQIKIWLSHTLFEERKKLPAHFTNAAYNPLTVNGAYKEHLMAFARVYKNSWYVVILPLNVAALCRAQNKDVLALDWRDTHVVLPKDAPAHVNNLLTGEQGKREQKIEPKAIFKQLPFAVFKMEHPVVNRSSGVLLPIFSLSSPYGTGDFGPEARKFADLLFQSEQKYWQMLPLTPVEPQKQYSPYSSYSSMAGNTLLISPDLLAADGLLSQADLTMARVAGKSRVDYKEAERIKQSLLDKAWNNFKTGKIAYLQSAFEQFCDTEAYWLHDFAQYIALKQTHQHKPWYEWPDEFKLKKKKALTQFIDENPDGVEKAKWLQFIFAKQWKSLKNYCHEREIQLFGDLPFYVSYDSADVWSNPELFSLDKQLNLKTVAGVPPDYFNENGQLWGMPVFCWDKLKEQNYDWWIKRIRRNIELFDLLRLDHFRAFSSYWSVPADEKTAINGNWETAPGVDFFKALKAEFGKLPFVAEDLGDIDIDVYKLRDKFRLPGMKVLQFAFGEDMHDSPHIPHNYTPNYIAYTGTHDNNTTLGWYRAEIGKTEKLNLRTYSGMRLHEEDMPDALVKMAMASVAKTTITSMQDLLGLDETARMNKPAEVKENWVWRLKPGELNSFPVEKLKEWTRLYNRS